MLRTLALVAVRQQADEARHAQPLALTRRQELVEDHLGAVGEVAELGLPTGQRHRLGHRVAVLKPEHRLFRQHRVDDLEPGLIRGDVLQRRVAALVLLVDQHRMALRERAAFDVLARQADGIAFGRQGAKRQMLGHAPIKALAGVDHLAALIEQADNRLVGAEIRRDGRDRFADALEAVDVDASYATAGFVVGQRQARPAAIEPVGLVGTVAGGGRELTFKMGPEARSHAFEFVGRDDAFLDQLAAIHLGDRRVGLDLLVHQRLRERWLVALVVAEAAITEHVDDDRLLELLPELGCDLGDVDDRFRVVAVDVEDRRFDHQSDVGAVRRRARVARVGGEADLVVDHEVDRTARAVTLEARQPETLGHNALTGKRRVAVNEQRHHRGAIVRLAAMLVLLGANLTQHHGVDDLKVRRVGRQRQVDVVAIERAVGRGAKVVLHVARSFDVVGLERTTLELREDRAVGLAHDLGKHVQAPAVGHAEHDFADAKLAAALDDLLKRRDHRFATVEAKPLRAGELDVDEFLERLRLDQLVEDRLLTLVGEADVLLLTLDALLDPGLLHRVGNVRELHADVPAVGATQDLQDLTHGRRFKAEHAVEEDRPVEVGIGEAVGLGLQFLVDLAVVEAEWIEVGNEVAHHAIGADQHQRADAVLRRAHRRDRVHLEALGVGLLRDALADALFHRAIVAGQRTDKVTIGRQLLQRRAPGRRSASVAFASALFLQALEKVSPLVADRPWVLLVLGLHLFDVGGIRSGKERGDGKLGVQSLTGHLGFLC